MSFANNLSKINPFLAAAFPVIFLYGKNSDETRFLTALNALLVVLGATLILMIIMWVATRSSIKPGFLAVIWILLFFSYGSILSIIDGWSVAGFEIGRQRYLLVAEVLLAVVTLWIVLRTSINLYKITPYVTVVLTILILINLVTVISNQFGSSGQIKHGEDRVGHQLISNLDHESMADIYYIILDSYPRQDVLQEIYQYDNSRFIEYLKGKGFLVGSQSQSNYVLTSLSVTSSLNMEYITDLLDDLDPGSKDQLVLLPLIENNRVMQLAKKAGYRFAFVRSYSPLFLANPNADIKLTPQVYTFQKVTSPFVNAVMGNPFGSTLMRSTALRGFIDSWLGTTWAQLFLESIAQLKAIPNLDGPVFTMAHIYPPHPPYIFDRFGNQRNLVYKFPDSWNDKESYIEQLIFVNESIKDVVQTILTESQGNAIIIIQGDHGSSTHEVGNSLYYGGLPAPELVQERIGILNAIHLPSHCYSNKFYDSISPVNTFRLVFDMCLGSDFGLLPDQTYWSTYNRPYDLSKIDGSGNYVHPTKK